MTNPKDSASQAQTVAGESLLVVRCQLGEVTALDQLVDLWHGRLWAFVARLMADSEAQRETVQDLWLRILRGLPKLRDPSRFGPWAYRIARLTVMDRLRARYADPTEPPNEVSDPPAAAVDFSLPFHRRDLDRALARLPWGDREVVVLFYLQELSLKEVASVLDIPAGTVKSRLHRARLQLREILESPSSPLGIAKD